MLLRLFLVSVWFGLVTVAQAEVQVEDPKMVLKQLESSFKSKSIEEMFQCGQKARYQPFAKECSYRCFGITCMAICTDSADKPTYRQYVGECTDGEVSIYTEAGEEIYFTEEDFKKGYGTLAYSTFRDLDLYTGLEGKLVIESVVPTFYSIRNAGGNRVGRVLPAVRVSGKFYVKSLKSPLKVELYLKRDVPGVAQIAELTVAAHPLLQLVEYLGKGD